MNLSEYISGYFVRELRLSPDSPIAKKLNLIRSAIYFFLFVNFFTCLYAFVSVFHSYWIAIPSTILFQFVFLMIYIVLFSTIRKAEFQRVVNNKLTPVVQEEIEGLKYPVRKFVLNDENKIYKRRWSEVIFRMILLMAVGFGPAYFFGIMTHHLATAEDYVSAKKNFINNQIKAHEQLNQKEISGTKLLLDSLRNTRSLIAFKIDSLQKNPDVNGYYLEDIKWQEKLLTNFDQLNNNKILWCQKKIDEDSLASIVYAEKIENHFKSSDYFQLRYQVTIKNFPVTYYFAVVIFLLLLLYPFYLRYRLIVKDAAALDDLLEAHHEKLIHADFELVKKNILHSTVVTRINEFLADADNDNEIQKNEMRHILMYLEQYGDNYHDPAVRAKQKHDTRVFVEKGNLGRYLGKL